jgi:putative endonuclease
MGKSNWEVYIIRTSSGMLYTGITTDLERRLKEHKNGKKGARFFHISNAEEVVFREPHENRSQASKREAEVKKMTKSQKEALIVSRTL